MVRVVVASLLARATKGEREVVVSASTLEEALAQLTERYGDSFQSVIYDSSGSPKRFLNFYVNGRNVHFLKNLKTRLEESDELTILPSVGGG